MANLIEGLLNQIDRVKEIKKVYDEIPQGKFGAVMIQQSIDNAKKAIKDNDVFAMVTAYKDLEEIKL